MVKLTIRHLPELKMSKLRTERFLKRLMRHFLALIARLNKLELKMNEMLTFSWCAFRGRELLEVLVERVVFEARVHPCLLQDSFVVVVEPKQGVGGPTFLFLLLKVGFFLRIRPVVRLQHSKNTHMVKTMTLLSNFG